VRHPKRTQAAEEQGFSNYEHKELMIWTKWI